MKLSEEDLRKAREFCEDELSSYMLYLALAQQERGKLAEQLRQAAEQERGHYEFWRSVVGSDCSVRPPGRAFRVLLALSFISAVSLCRGLYPALLT